MPDKQEAPLRFRPYPPIKQLIEHAQEESILNTGKELNINWQLNVAMGMLYGLTPEELEQYRREK